MRTICTPQSAGRCWRCCTHRMEDIGWCPVEDYITSPLLSTWIQGNLVEPQLCQRFPFLSLAPLHRQLHYNWGFRRVSNLHNLNPTANSICNNRISLCPEECFVKNTCSFSSPLSFASIKHLHTHNWTLPCTVPLGILRLKCVAQVHVKGYLGESYFIYLFLIVFTFLPLKLL